MPLSCIIMSRRCFSFSRMSACALATRYTHARIYDTEERGEGQPLRARMCGCVLGWEVCRVRACVQACVRICCVVVCVHELVWKKGGRWEGKGGKGE